MHRTATSADANTTAAANGPAFLLPLHDVTRNEAKPHRKRTGLLVNIIPFNEGAEAGDAGGLNGFKRPSQETVQSFQVSASSCVGVREPGRVMLGAAVFVDVVNGGERCSDLSPLAYLTLPMLTLPYLTWNAVAAQTCLFDLT